MNKSWLYAFKIQETGNYEEVRKFMPLDALSQV